jgi:N-acetylmuramoyl-L-alanine amidase
MIANDRLDFATPLPLNHVGRDFEPWRIVLHYSAGSTRQSAVNALNGNNLSYHVLIDRDGKAFQTRPFTKHAAHAGRSNWKSAGGIANGSSLNHDSIGICFINLGQFGFFKDGVWFHGFDRQTHKFIKPSIADAEANKATLIYTPARATHWSPYEPAQIETCDRILKDLIATYHIEEIVGHHDIAIGDKPDPGPLCPLEDWRVNLKMRGSLGLQSEVNSADGTLNLRDRPGGSDSKVVATLRNGDVVHIRAVTYTSASRGLVPPSSGRALSAWASVDIDGTNKHAGFVHMKFLTRNPLAPEFQTALMRS